MQFADLAQLSTPSSASGPHDANEQTVARLETERAEILARLEQIDRELLAARGQHSASSMCACCMTGCLHTRCSMALLCPGLLLVPNCTKAPSRSTLSTRSQPQLQLCHTNVRHRKTRCSRCLTCLWPFPRDLYRTSILTARNLLFLSPVLVLRSIKSRLSYVATHVTTATWHRGHRSSSGMAMRLRARCFLQPARSVEDNWMHPRLDAAQVATSVTSASSTFRAARSFWLTHTLILASSPSSVDSVISPSHAPSDCVPTSATTTIPLLLAKQFGLALLSFGL